MKYVLALSLALLVGCTSAERQFRLEEWGEGWQLNVEEHDGRKFTATWVKGDHRSLQLLNYHDAPRGGYTVVNTLYLEVDGQGTVQRGMLKRYAVPEFSESALAEAGAKWWRVLEGWCRIDETGHGTVQVRCEGAFNFEGVVEPRDNLEIKRPE
jgi:hypothetical protein